MNRRTAAALAAFILFILLPSGSVLAAGGDEIIAPLNQLTEIMYAVVRAVGVLVLTYNPFALFTSIKSHDASQRDNAIMGVACSIGIIFIPDIIKWIL